MIAAALVVAGLVAAAVGGPEEPGAAGVAPAGAPEEAPPPRQRNAVVAEGDVSAFTAFGGIATVGVALRGRIGPLALVYALDFPARASSAEPRLERLGLVGAGLVHDLSPRLDGHAVLLVGSETLQLRDYVHGGWREVEEAAFGARVGLEWHTAPPRPGGVAIGPVLGVSATALSLGRGSDRLRGAEWGGFAAMLSVTIGVELAQRPRPPAPAE